METPDALEECLDVESGFHYINNKRDMTLSLHSIEEYKYSKFIADQTPTPTRLIRNCEEFGLFDDLKHVNPFEETFRQAIGDKSKTSNVLLTTQRSIEAIKSNDEDTSHTPNIFPFNSILCENKDATKSDKKTPNAPKDEQQIATVLDAKSPQISGSDEPMNVKKDIDEELEKSSSTENAPKSQSSKKYKVGAAKVFRKIHPKPIVVPMIYNTLNPTKEKIRQSLLKLQANHKKDTMEISVPIINVHPPPINNPNDVELSKADDKRLITKGKHSIFKDNDTNERNREAAKRYRNKQKMLHDALMLRNTQLETENAMLKKQLHSFKKAHENCSVTRNNEALTYK